MNQERRKYIRLDSAFPVSFKLLSIDGKHIISGALQGFTNNIGKGGICLSVNNLKPELAALIKTGEARIYIEIEMPLRKEPVSAMTRAAWVKEPAHFPGKYLIGLDYEQMPPSGKKRLLCYAYTKKFSLPIALGLVILLATGFIINSYINIKLSEGNKALVEQLVKIMQDSNLARKKLEAISKEKQGLELKIEALELRIQLLDEERAKAKEASSITEKLNASLEKLTREKAALQEKLINLQRKESAVSEGALNLSRRKTMLEKANFEKMYQWLVIHQSPRTGLLMSFEGDNDIAGWGFTYEQSLAAQAYIFFGDFERARKIFDFFHKQAKRGPDIWLGIALLQYTNKTKDQRYLGLAEEIAGAIINLQTPDAYAFFKMLYKITNNQKYREAQDEALTWFIGHSAADTCAWAIPAIGAQKLEELGMNPERIMEFADKGFDLTPQMALSFKIMAGFYAGKNMQVKSKFYETKAEEYLTKLSNMVILSPSLSGNAYALFARYNYNPLELQE